MLLQCFSPPLIFSLYLSLWNIYLYEITLLKIISLPFGLIWYTFYYLWMHTSLLDSLFCSLNVSVHASTNTEYYNHTLVSKSGDKSLQSYFSFSSLFWLIHICFLFIYVLESVYQFLKKKKKTLGRKDTLTILFFSFSDESVYLHIHRVIDFK